MLNNKTFVLLTSGSIAVAGWILGKYEFTMANQVLMVTAAAIAGYPIAKNALTSLRFKVVGIEALVTIAAVGAILIGEYWEAAAVTILFALGSFLEAKTMDKTRNAIQSLVELAPLKAVIKSESGEREVPAEEVNSGDIVAVKPGGKIPVDGSIIKGRGTINESHVTGEPMPVEKGPGEKVYSGTINDAGYLEIRTEKAGDDTTFAKILNLVEEAQESKSPTERFLTKFSRYYTPGIIILSLLTYLFTRDTKMALTLLVIACPGALVIATPVSIVSAIGNGARKGALVKGGEHLEKAGKINIVAFDKTGTLTYGRPAVKKVKAFQGTETNVIEMAASVETNSEHHLARAITDAAGSQAQTADDFIVFPGKGASGIVTGSKVLVGNRGMMHEERITIPAEVEEYLQGQEEKGYTGILVAQNKSIVGVISIADQVRESAPAVINQLKNMGIDKVVMLTGDNQRTASSIAKELGIDEFKAGLLPEEKVEAINGYIEQGNTVAMVGDGINDAPALATANIGVAMGAAGTDVAIEVADIVLMGDKLSMVPYVIGLSKSALRNIKQNITFAVLVVAALLAGVLSKYVFLASGMLAHEASVMIVILNSMRLLIYKGEQKERVGGAAY
ncbi:MAG: cadmium-translocating P-type ATPase [Firmicutes bacterium]|nr:cadmium-translocating P-type ATPase [Bacillota bacterium]